LCTKETRHIPQADRSLQGPELPDETVIDHLLASPYKTKFCILFNGAWEKHYGSGAKPIWHLPGFLRTSLVATDARSTASTVARACSARKWDEQRGEFTYGDTNYQQSTGGNRL
jgi:hypothetical protein